MTDTVTQTEESLGTPVSTISISDIIPEATKAIERYTKRSDTHSILTRYDTHLSTEDLVMATVEKVVKANPTYLTKTYVWLAAKSVCINQCQRKRIETVDVVHPFTYEDGYSHSLEDEIEGDAYNHVDDLFIYLVKHLNPEEQELLHHLLEGKMYVDIAETLGISLRTLERKVHDLKWKTEYLLTEEDPDVNPLVY